MLRGAGVRGENAVGVFFGAKMALLVVLPIIGWLLVRHAGFSTMVVMFVPFATGVFGLVLPDMIVKQMRKRFMARLEKGLPDALDMMVICAQAGLALGPTLYRVGVELQNAHWEVAQELAQTVNELQMVSDSRIALINLGTRTGIDGFKRLGTTLVQTMQYGTPLTDALRTLSAEMRQDMLTKFEARAARLPVLLTMPTILFILPCVFMIAGGPAIIQIFRAF
jgi:tight adherence protein C